MIDNLEILLTPEYIYLLVNWGVIPFWLLLIFAPNHYISRFFVHSVIAPTILAAAYIFLSYKIFQNGNILESFNLYLGLEELYAIFSDEEFLLIFWLHFLSISLFTGAWIARDSQRYAINKILLMVSLLITYFSGPIGLVIYWLIRIFYAKKITFNE